MVRWPYVFTYPCCCDDRIVGCRSKAKSTFVWSNANVLMWFYRELCTFTCSLSRCDCLIRIAEFDGNKTHVRLERRWWTESNWTWSAYETKLCVIDCCVAIDEIECSEFDVGECTGSIHVERDRLNDSFDSSNLMRINVDNTGWCTTFVQWSSKKGPCYVGSWNDRRKWKERIEWNMETVVCGSIMMLL